MHGRRTPLVASVGAGLAVGALSAVGRDHFHGTLEAFANSTSTWLVAPFAIGALAGSRRDAAALGIATCLFQLAGYYLIDVFFTAQDEANDKGWFNSAFDVTTTGAPGLILDYSGGWTAEGGTVDSNGPAPGGVVAVYAVNQDGGVPAFLFGL